MRDTGVVHALRSVTPRLGHRPLAEVSTGPCAPPTLEERLTERFRDRTEAGRALARRLRKREDGARWDLNSPVILALPRGGVPVGAEVARALGAPLDVLIVRKLGVPGQPELAMGAVASGGVRVLNAEIVDDLRLPESVMERVVEEQMQEVERREGAYRGPREPAEVEGRTAILVDDGIATGSSMVAAVRALRKRGPAAVVVAVTVAPVDACRRLEAEADGVVCLVTPEPFYAVGLWYDSFPQLTDAEVRTIFVEATVPGG